jgi:hypothetical protein
MRGSIPNFGNAFSQSDYQQLMLKQQAEAVAK